ncbi:MAG TPA: hypothetical protein V6D27_04435 [Vampirovibrionales bacterium]
MAYCKAKTTLPIQPQPCSYKARLCGLRDFHRPLSHQIIGLLFYVPTSVVPLIIYRILLVT